jgi:hypothetical protein
MHVKHEGGKIHHQQIRPQKEQHHQGTFDTLTEEGRMAFEAYRADLEELFFSCYKMTWQRAILKDTAPIIIRKAEVTPEVQLNSSLLC